MLAWHTRATDQARPHVNAATSRSRKTCTRLANEIMSFSNYKTPEIIQFGFVDQ